LESDFFLLHEHITLTSTSPARLSSSI